MRTVDVGGLIQLCAHQRRYVGGEWTTARVTSGPCLDPRHLPVPYVSRS